MALLLGDPTHIADWLLASVSFSYQDNTNRLKIRNLGLFKRRGETKYRLSSSKALWHSTVHFKDLPFRRILKNGMLLPDEMRMNLLNANRGWTWHVEDHLNI